jgi:hypothetical protein
MEKKNGAFSHVLPTSQPKIRDEGATTKRYKNNYVQHILHKTASTRSWNMGSKCLFKLICSLCQKHVSEFLTKISRMWHSSIKAARMEKQKCSYIHVVHSGHMLTSHQNVYKLFEVVIMCELLFRSNARAFN